jgi:hypothetical protein
MPASRPLLMPLRPNKVRDPFRPLTVQSRTIQNLGPHLSRRSLLVIRFSSHLKYPASTAASSNRSSSMPSYPHRSIEPRSSSIKLSMCCMNMTYPRNSPLRNEKAKNAKTKRGSEWRSTMVLMSSFTINTSTKRPSSRPS